MHNPTPSPFGTPDKRPQPDHSTLGFSSPVSKPWHQLEASGVITQRLTHSQNAHQSQCSSPLAERLSWLERKTQQLKIYIDNSPKIEHGRIREIFEWQSQGEKEEGQRREVLKELSLKVRALIRENNELRSGSLALEVTALKREKQRLTAMVDQLKRGEWVRQNILSEENHYLREYIARRKEDKMKQQPYFSIQDTYILPQIAIEDQISRLRKNVMTYINTVIESNDERLEAQEKYLRTLEKRIEQLSKYDEVLTHHRFEKTVKLQDSSRKNKNFTAAAPTLNGDYQASYDIQPELQLNSNYKRFFQGKAVKEPHVQQPNEKEMALLVLRSAQLQEELTSLREKYQIQIENHIRDSSDREQLKIVIQQLTAEKTDLRNELAALRDQLSWTQKGLSRVQKGGRNRDRGSKGFSLRQQVADIRKELLSCGVAPFQTLQRQFSSLITQRNLLQRQLQTTQVSKEGKFSSLHKEIFLLKEKNAQLELNCRFYEQQIEQYQQKLRQLNEEDETRLACEISRDFEEMSLREELSGFQWPKKAHECMLSSISRLQNIERLLTTSQNS